MTMPTIKRIVVSTYQSVSRCRQRKGMDELFQQTRAVFVADTDFQQEGSPSASPSTSFPKNIDVFMDDASTKEEWKMVAETRKMLDSKIKLTATCVRVPALHRTLGSGEHRVREPQITADEARDILRGGPVAWYRQARGRRLHHALESAGEDATYISRIREDSTLDNALNLWIVSDNLRKGAALNTIQIAELLLEAWPDPAEEEGG